MRKPPAIITLIAVLIMSVGVKLATYAYASESHTYIPALPSYIVKLKIPYCQLHPKADLCLESMGLHPNEQGLVVSGVELKTERKPGHTEILVQLWYKGLHGWIADRFRRYTQNDLPPVNHKGWLHPGVRAGCANGLWEIEMHIFGHTSKGNVRNEWFAWPGSKRKKDIVLATDHAGGIHSMYFPGFRIKCLA